MSEVSYFPEICEEILMMMEHGAIIDDVLKVLQISHETFNIWRNTYPEFDDAIKGLEVYDNIFTLKGL
jgi:hypothetical protein